MNIGENRRTNLSAALKKLKDEQECDFFSFINNLFGFVYKIKGNPQIQLNFEEEEKTIFPGQVFRHFRASRGAQIFLKNIHNSIVNKQKQGDWYPPGTTEQMLHAFFMEFLNTEGDLKSYVQVLPKVDENVQITSIKNLYLLIINEYFNRHILYEDNVTLIGNVKAQAFNQQAESFEPEISMKFTDCIETVVRNIMNIMLYDNVKGTFSLAKVQEINEHYIDKLKNFYEQQPVSRHSDSSFFIRSEFNKLVGDMNNVQGAQGREPIIYLETLKSGTQSSLEIGIVNIIYAFQHIFNLPLEHYNANNSLKEKEQWVINSFQTLLNHLNPDYQYQIELNGIENYQRKTHNTNNNLKPDLIGNVKITVSDNNKAPLYCFTIQLKNGPVVINNLQVLNKTTFLKEEQLQNIIRQFPSYHLSALESISLLLPQLKDSIEHPLYNIFSKILTNNNTYIDALKKIAADEKMDRSVKEGMLDHLLTVLGFDDTDVVENISPAIVTLLEKNQCLSILSKKVLKLNTRGVKNPVINLNKLQALEEFYAPSLTNKTLAFGKENTALKLIEIDSSKVNEIIGLDQLSALKKFTASYTCLNTLAFGEQNKALQEINIERCSVNEITGLDKLPALEKFYTYNSFCLKEVTFGEQNKALQEIVVSRSPRHSEFHRKTIVNGVENLTNVKMYA